VSCFPRGVRPAVFWRQLRSGRCFIIVCVLGSDVVLVVRYRGGGLLIFRKVFSHFLSFFLYSRITVRGCDLDYYLSDGIFLRLLFVNKHFHFLLLVFPVGLGIFSILLGGLELCLCGFKLFASLFAAERVVQDFFHLRRIG